MKDVLDFNLQQFLKGLIPERDLLLKEMEEIAQRDYISIVEPEIGHFLNLMVHMIKPENILEIGTAIGYSTICMARALPSNGTITTVEILEGRAAQARENFQRAGLAERITSIVGDAKAVVPAIEGQYDMIFLDAAKGQYGEFLHIAEKILKPGGIIIADNVLINGWVVDLDFPERRKKTMVYRMRNFLESLKNNDQYQCSLLPLGDGIALIRHNMKP